MRVVYVSAIKWFSSLPKHPDKLFTNIQEVVIATHLSVQAMVWSNMVNQFCLGRQHYFRRNAVSVKERCLTEFLVGHCRSNIERRSYFSPQNQDSLNLSMNFWVLSKMQIRGTERIILEQIFSDADPEFLELGIWLSLGIACNVFHINTEIRSHVPAPPLGLANVFQWFLWSIQWLLIWKLKMSTIFSGEFRKMSSRHVKLNTTNVQQNYHTKTVNFM